MGAHAAAPPRVSCILMKRRAPPGVSLRTLSCLLPALLFHASISGASPQSGAGQAASPVPPLQPIEGHQDIQPREVFVDVSAQRGIAFTTRSGATGKKLLVETMVGGVAWLDYDGDGFLDLYLVQGHGHPEKALDGPGSQQEPSNVLYRSLSGHRFEDVTAAAGVGHRGYGMGAAVGDYDGDGRPDLYVTNYGPDILYHNRGDGTFQDVTRSARLGAAGWSSSATWADLDGDGLLDLFVVTYLDYDTRRDGGCSATVPGTGERVLTYCHPHRFEGVADLLYRNLGDGTFQDVSRESGVAASRGWLEGKGLGVIATDFDNDGDVDILVANDSVPNTLWRNLGGLRFEDVALETGFALNGDGSPQAGMGIDRGDVDGDGLLDVLVTNFSREPDTLYKGLRGFFLDVTIERGLARATYLPLGFGARLLDVDLDGDLDIYVANGHILDNAERLYPGEHIAHAQPDLLLENDGTGSFRDVSARSGDWFRRALVGRGVAEADYDNDGDPDLLVTNVDGPATLLENRAGDGKPWIGLELRASGRQVTHDAWVELLQGPAATDACVHEVQTDGSYLSAHDPRVRFALDPGGGAPVFRVRWPGHRAPTLYEGLAPGRYHSIQPK